MSEPYLILHKVRGVPTFDIAERCDDMGTESDPGPWWIIPTSGHRAYPYRHWNIDDLFDGSDMDMPKPLHVMETVDPPESCPDHYSVNATPSTPKPSLSSILTTLGLVRPIKRRKITP